MGLLPTQEGHWWLKSESDPRWNVSGQAFVGGLDMPAECELALDALKKKYGEAPKDLTWDFTYD